MKLAIVSPINERCGVAEYSRLLKNQLEIRSEIKVELISYKKLSSIADLKSSLLHIQYVPGLFPDKELFRRTVMNYPHKIIITAHHFDSFLKSIRDDVDYFIVHDKEYQRLTTSDDDSITIQEFLVQGCPVFEEIDNKKELRKELGIPFFAKVMCSYGFIMKWKRLDYVLQSFAPYLALNRDLFIIMLHSYHEHDEEEGIRVEKELERIINYYNIDSQCVINHTFLDKEVINKYIQASDIGILFSFDAIGSHGSSAVMKEYISGRCPVIASDIPHYGDVNINLNAKIPAGDITSFIYRTLDMLYNTDELGLWKRTMRRLYEEHNYDEFAKKHIEIYNQL